MIQPWLHYQKGDFRPVILFLSLSPLSLCLSFKHPMPPLFKKNICGLEVAGTVSHFHHFVSLIIVFHQYQVTVLLCVRYQIQDGPSVHSADLASVQEKANTSCKSITDVIICLLIPQKGLGDSEWLVSQLVSQLCRSTMDQCTSVRA